MIHLRLFCFILLAATLMACKPSGSESSTLAPAAPAPVAATNTPAPVAPATTTATPKPKPTAAASVPPPDGATVVRCNGANVTLRGGPRQDAQSLGNIKQGQRLYLIKYSDNSDTINGIESNWAYVQTENGKKGWVFGHYVQ